MLKIQEYLINNIKFYRKKLKITQEELAELCNVSANYIGRIEIGYHFPSPEVLEKITEVLKIEPYELFANPYELKTVNKNDFETKKVMMIEKLTKEINKTIKKVINNNFNSEEN